MLVCGNYIERYVVFWKQPPDCKTLLESFPADITATDYAQYHIAPLWLHCC